MQFASIVIIRKRINFLYIDHMYCPAAIAKNPKIQLQGPCIACCEKLIIEVLEHIVVTVTVVVVTSLVIIICDRFH